MLKTIQYPYNVQYCSLSNGCNIAYMDEGKGPQTLVFVHGLASYATSWKKNIAYLKDHFRCIAIDLPGNGLSDHGDHPYGISFFANAVYDFINCMGLENICLVGHSMGAQIAMMTLVKYPSCAKNLILCAPAGFETFTPFESTIYHSTIHFFDFFSTEENSLRKVLESSFYNNPMQSGEMVKDLVDIMKLHPISDYRKMIEACIKSLLDEPVYDNISSIQQPTLVLFGERDALIPNRLMHHYTTKRLAEETVKLFPNAKLEMVENCGHFVQWEKAEEVSTAIEDFLLR